MHRKKSDFPPHACSICPLDFIPISHHCTECPDVSPPWRGTASDHLLLSARFHDHQVAIHGRRPGVERDLETGAPLDHVSPAGTRAFLDPRLQIHDIPFVSDPSFVGFGRPHPSLEKEGFDVWQACAITGLRLQSIYHVQGSVRTNDGGLHELFEECRRPDGSYSPIELWEFRIDILDSRAAETAAQKRLRERQELLTRHGVDEQELAIEASLFSRARYRGAPSDEEPPIIYGDLA